MNKNILVIWLTMFAWLLPVTSKLVYSADTSSPEQVVAEFQKLPHYEMFCNDEKWLGAVLAKFDVEYKKYFSKKLYKLFLWSECVEPATPPHYTDMKNYFDYDIRFSIPYGNVYLRKKLNSAENIIIKTISNMRPDQTIVRVDFNLGSTKRFTRYTLIQEDGSWKIDDISPQATFVNGRQPADNYGYEIADYNFSSDSIKTDMQKNYDAAMKRYTQEQGAKPKP